MRRALIAILLLTLVTAACAPSAGGPSPTEADDPTPADPQATAVPAATATALPPAVVLVASEFEGAALTAPLSDTLQALASDSGLRFVQLTPEQVPASLPEPLALLVTVQPAGELIERLRAAEIEPGRLVAIAPGEELEIHATVIGRTGPRPDQEAFLAGYSAAVLSNNYRVAVISAEGASPPGSASAFIAGARYYCGLCRAAYPPFADYPASVRLNSPPDEAGAAGATQQLQEIDIRSVYLAPGLENGPLPAAIAAAEINLLARQRPQGFPQERWLASIRPAPEQAVRTYWQQLIAGEAPDQIPLPLAVSDRNSQLFTDARFRLVEEVLQDLVDGYIDTGVTAP